jgi:hypothetical protein
MLGIPGKRAKDSYKIFVYVLNSKYRLIVK